jgi:hypothetical protein
VLFESDDGMTPSENVRRPTALKMSGYLPNRAQCDRGVKATTRRSSSTTTPAGVWSARSGTKAGDGSTESNRMDPISCFPPTDASIY